ncbi:MAG: nitrous oxide-stimulated promoter family protein, partial [Veillonella sp.]|nr:nitrous oxide-stimulated promoter family protein [Veillonella sp.]
MTVDEKRQLELKTMYQIIGIYCRDKHHTPKGELCEECQDVWHYAE